VPWTDKDDEEDDFPMREGVSRLSQDADFRIKILKWFWLIALVMMLFGYGIMVLVILGRSPFG
jgi:hypothetical protein